MWITKKTYEDLVKYNDTLKKMNLSLMQEKNDLYKENFEMAKELESLKAKKTTRKTTKKEDIVKKTTTRKPRTKKEDK